VNLDPQSELTSTLRLLRKLGEGGMGSVWIAEHRGLSTEVVVKFMSPEIAKHEPSVARFTQEAALAAKVRHPHVVQVFDHGVSEGGVPFIVMEMLEGRTLADELDARFRLIPGEVSAIVAQTAKALRRVHELGLVHRDIKPENIFLCEIGNGEMFVKILDFGIAKARTDAASSLTSTGVTMGTPFYMSPELIVSAKYVDKQADLWALAIVAFEALTGVRPFNGETVGAVSLELHSGRRPRVSELLPGMPPELDAWFDRAFAKNPADRFPDARTMARALCAIVPPIRSSLAPDEPMRLDTGPVSALTPVSEKMPDSIPLGPHSVTIARASAPADPESATLATLKPAVPPAKKRAPFLAIGAAALAIGVALFAVARREPSAAAAKMEMATPPPPAPVETKPSAETFVAKPTASVEPQPAPTPSASVATSKTAIPTAKPASKPAPKKPASPKTFDDIQ
jgi:serine/threonine-protein kinase